MTNTHDVISAFLDDELFEAQELADALADPAGRALLIDLVALRCVVQPSAPVPSLHELTTWRRPVWLVVTAAAALVVTLATGYAIGRQNAQMSSVEAPPPSRVVEAVPFTPVGGMR